MVKHLAVIVVFLALAAPAFAQQCLHDSSEQPSQQTRREQALKLALQINTTEAMAPLRFRPLAELPIPPPPPGFTIQLFTDGVSYTFSLRDTLDPCHYAIFSDQEKFVYDGTPRRGTMVTPVDTN